MANWSGRTLTYRDALKESPTLPCSECSGSMTLRNSRYGFFYGCSRFPDCRATHGAHPDGQPLGLKRKSAYGWLRKRCPDLPLTSAR